MTFPRGGSCDAALRLRYWIMLPDGYRGIADEAGAETKKRRPEP